LYTKQTKKTKNFVVRHIIKAHLGAFTKGGPLSMQPVGESGRGGEGFLKTFGDRAQHIQESLWC